MVGDGFVDLTVEEILYDRMEFGIGSPDGEKPPNSSLNSYERWLVDALNVFSGVDQRPQTRTADSEGSIPSEVTLH